MADSGLSFSNPIFAQFAFYAGVVLLKTWIVGYWTVFYRQTKKVASNQEDVDFMTGTKDEKKPITNDPDVERVRRCHLNDLENVLPFVLIGLLYVLTGPSAVVAGWFFRTFAFCRIMHTIAYLKPLPPPSRSLFFIIGSMVNLCMMIVVIRAGVF